jgi:DNA polymerase-3 subunit epsilon
MEPALLDPQSMALALESHPDYRVLRRLVPRVRFDHVAKGPQISVLVLDTETTGLSQAKDKIIELAMLRFDLDTSSGQPVGEIQVYDGLEDPGSKLSAFIINITGITDEMVKGQQLDEQRINAMLDGVSLVIAHNAAFDRPFVEARLPQFKTLAWACSFADVDWKQEGRSSAKLENLASAQSFFYDAHRAETDCHALLAVLEAQLPVSGQTGFARLLAAASQPAFVLQATGAPFESKDLLKARAYRWHAENRVWRLTLADETLLEREFAWLRQHVYGHKPAKVLVEKLDARSKYSSRSGDSRIVSI